MMAMPIMVVASRIPREGTGQNGRVQEVTVTYEGSAGPRELLELIAIQAHAAVKGLETGAYEELVVPDPMEPATESNTLLTSSNKGKERVVHTRSEENEQLLGFWSVSLTMSL